MSQSPYVSYLLRRLVFQRRLYICITVAALLIAAASMAPADSLPRMLAKQIYLDAEVAYLKAQNKDYIKDLQDLQPPCMEQATFEATAYESSEISCGRWARYGKTRMQTIPSQLRTVAVDPSVIPLGSLVRISGIGVFIAEDTGSAIKGRKVDIFVDSLDQAREFGRKEVVVFYQNRACFDSLVKESKNDRGFNFLALYSPSDRSSK